VQDLMARHTEVAEVIWFGSWVAGQASRHSDVDICLLLSFSPIARIRDRIPLYLPDRFPGGIDVFPYTLEEFAALELASPSWWRTIRSGRTLARRTPKLTT
jgi:predicted nucleotidyltransferase